MRPVQASAVAVARAATPRCVAELSVAQLAGHTIAALFTQRTTGAAADLVAVEQVGSLVLLGTPTNRATLVADLDRIEAAAPGTDPLFMVDEEGGRVQRLRQVLGDLPAAASQATLPSGDLTALWTDHAAAMSALGFDIGLAPVLDIGAGVGIGTRSFGSTTSGVADAAEASIRGMQSGGIVPTLKHFPGHGGTDTDSHIDLPTTAPIGQLDLDAYRRLLDDRLTVMVGHLDVPGLTEPGEPTSLSPAAYALLRNDLGFDGLIMTDALNMGAVVRTAATRSTSPAVGALVAGADIVMVDITEAAASHADIVDAVQSGTLPIARLEAAAQRVLTLKSACS